MKPVAYKVVDGNKVDSETLQGWKTWRALACERCHGAKQEGMVGPSLIDAFKTLDKNEFHRTVFGGRVDKGMPDFSSSQMMQKNWENLYRVSEGALRWQDQPGRSAGNRCKIRTLHAPHDCSISRRCRCLIECKPRRFVPIRSRAMRGARDVPGATAFAQGAGGPPPTLPNNDGADGVLRVCADPNNMPLSNKKGEGYENKIASQMASDFGYKLEYTYWPQRMGFVRNTLREKVPQTERFKCDLIIGVPKGYELTATTRPYLHSTYAMVFPNKPEYASIKTPVDLHESAARAIEEDEASASS